MNQDSQVGSSSQAEVGELKSGFTWRSALAIVFSSVVLLPVVMYVYLVSGQVLAGAAVYITVLLFTETTRMFGTPLKKQEVFIIYSLVGGAAYNITFLELIYRSYFLHSPIANAFIDPFTKLPLPQVIPSWWAPSLGSSAYLHRSLIASDWTMSIAISIVYAFFWICEEIALSFIMTNLYVEEEKLPFPFAQIDAAAITTLSERDPARLHLFALSALINIIYSALLYGIPIIAGIFAVQLVVLPIPWVDLNFLMERILPGSSFGIATDLLMLTAGFVVPWNVVIWMFIGSIAVWVFGSNLALTTFGSVFPEWIREWKPGMNLSLTYQRSTLWVWMSPQIGFAIAAALVPLALNYKVFIRAIKGLSRLSGTVKRETYIPLPAIIALYLIGIGGSILVFGWLVPDFPIWVPAILSLGWTVVNALMATRALGETGYQISVPYIWEGTIMLSGYQRIDAWFAAPIIGGLGAPYFTSSLKLAYLTETKPSDYIKAYLFMVPISWIAAFFYTELLWSIAPIPSSVYPITVIQYPIRAIQNGLWWSRQLSALRPEMVALGFGAMLIIGIIGEVLVRFAHFPFSLIGLVSGTFTLPPYAIMLFVGGILGRYIIPRILGEEWWNKNKLTVVAGMTAGEGVVIGIASALALMTKASWILPY